MNIQVLPQGRAFSFICGKERMVGMGREIFDRAREACDTRTMADVLADDCEELLQEGIPFAESPLASWNVLLYEAYVALGGRSPGGRLATRRRASASARRQAEASAWTR